MRRELAIVAVLAVGLTAVAGAAAPREVRLTDHKGDTAVAPLDVAGVRFGLGPDRRLRAIVTMAGRWENSALLGQQGPPGSVCIRLWRGDPVSTRPTRLVCATVRADGTTLRAEISPAVKGATATASRPSARSLTLRFPQSVLNRPRTVRFVVEATRAGCDRISCIDRAPEPPRAAIFRLP